MVQGKSVTAGILGVICAIAILASVVLAQGGAVFGAPMEASVAPSATSSSSITPSSPGLATVETTSNTANSNVSPGDLNSFVYGTAVPSSNSAQTIGSPSFSIGNIVLLGIVSLIVSLGVVFAVSRRLN